MELKLGDFFWEEVFVGNKTIWELIRKEKNEEDESVKRSKCWTFQWWAEKAVLINITFV